MISLYVNIYGMVILGAGLIPISKLNNRVYFLLGKDLAYQKWSDFGGKSELFETPLDTAIREGYEETNGFLGSQKEIRKNILNHDLPVFKTKNSRHSCYLMNIEYEKNLPNYINNNFNFIKENLPTIVDTQHNGLYEKDRVNWFTIEELRNFTEFRGYFKNIVWNLDKKYDTILDKL